MTAQSMLSEIELIADDIGILNHGRLLFEGRLDALRSTARTQGFDGGNLEAMFLAMIEQDNAKCRERAKL